MQFELTEEFITALNEAIEKEDLNLIEELIGELHPPDLAEMMEKGSVKGQILVQSFR